MLFVRSVLYDSSPYCCIEPAATVLHVFGYATESQKDRHFTLSPTNKTLGSADRMVYCTCSQRSCHWKLQNIGNVRGMETPKNDRKRRNTCTATSVPFSILPLCKMSMKSLVLLCVYGSKLLKWRHRCWKKCSALELKNCAVQSSTESNACAPLI
jgi:hypothetical protein